jgi:hypothetical protein
MGRKPIKMQVQTVALDILGHAEFPVSCNVLKKEIRQRLGKNTHFDTVKKYLDDLVRKDMIFRKELPPAKKEHKKGVVLYSKKPFPAKW